MKKALLIFVFSLYNLLLFAQQNEKGIIRGKVVEEVGGLPIPGAVVAITEAKQTVPLVTFQTDGDGLFKFERLKLGTYTVKISFIGFNSVVRSDISITANDFDQNIGTVKLLESPNSLNEVVISTEKPLIETDGDVITYNVGSSVLAEGSSAVDILKDVPMVEVDIDGKPSIVGMRSTRVFINGKPSDYMTANIADLLNVLPSDAVEKIEVMTNPPAKYSADGEGVINIVLRKDFKVGFNGNLSAGAGIQGDKNAGLNASYKGKNYSVNGGGSIRSSLGRSKNNNYRTNNFPDTTYYYNQFNNTESDNDGKNFRAGLNWDITKSQNLRLSTNFSQSGGEGISNNDFYYITEEQMNKRLQRQYNSTDRDAKSFVFNSDYDLRLDTLGNKLSAGFTANASKNYLFRSFDRSYVFPQNLKPSLQQNNNSIANHGINANFDYEKSTTDRKHRVELGLALGIRQNRNDLLVENYNFNTQIFIKNLRLSNDFLYHEKIFALYSSYNYRLNGWTAKAAVRAEYTDVNFDLSDGSSYNLSPYWSAFPSFTLGKYFKKKYNLALTYGMRINRPREGTLNPQINDTDTLNITYGNPNLVPSYTNQFSLNFSVFGQSWSFTPRFAYSRASGVIERFRMVHSNGVSETTYDNVGSNYYLSYILLGNYRPTKRTSLNGNFTLIQSQYRSTMNSYLNRSGYSIQSRAGMTLQISKSTAFEGSLYYANNLVAQGRNKSSISTSLAAKQNFFKNRLTFRVSTTDPFKGSESYSYNEGRNFTAENFQENNTNNFTFQLIYRYTRIKVDKVKVPLASKVIKTAEPANKK
jgi:hypothetical protein